MKIIVYIVYGVSQVLYKLFGVNTPTRKAWLKQEADKLQKQLNIEHGRANYVNTQIDGVYTTKRALEIAKDKGWF